MFSRHRSLVVVSTLIAASCTQSGSPRADPAVELEGIEATRNAFMSAIAEKRYADLGAVVTEDLLTVPPGSTEWQVMGALGIERGTPFPYDSIRMQSMETVLASDSVAWDLGTSRVYYTDADGSVQELRDTYLAILKKGSDGVWRLHREVASSLVR